MPKPAKIILGLLVGYVGLIVAFESMIGILQPEQGQVLTITTAGDDGVANDRVLAWLDDDGTVFVSANHWPRAWYYRALENPDVSVTREGKTTDYHAVPVSGKERERLLDESGFPLVAYLFTGFAPRQFLRLDPR